MAYVAKASCNYTVKGQPMVATYHFFLDGNSGSTTPHTTSVAELAGKLNTFLTTPLKAFLASVDSTLDNYTVVSLPHPLGSGTPDQAAVQVNAAGSLGLAAQDTPKPLCGLIRLHTGTAARYGRGRSFMPPLRISDDLNGDVFRVATTRYRGHMDDFKAQLDHLTRGGSAWSSSEDGRLVVYSRTRDQAGVTPYFFDVTSTEPRDQVHWLERRQVF